MAGSHINRRGSVFPGVLLRPLESSSFWRDLGALKELIGLGSCSLKSHQDHSPWHCVSILAQFIIIFGFIYFMYMCVLPVCIYMYHVYPVPSEFRRGHWVPWNWGNGWL